MTTAAVFAALHHNRVPFVLPNAWDVASAVILNQDGFPAVGTTSLGITAAAGLADGAGAGQSLTVALARQLVPRLDVPLSVDLEGGYSDDPAAVADLVVELAHIGVAGINLEDGTDQGGLRSFEQHTAIIAAVARATPAVFINARTDTYWHEIGDDAERPHGTIRRLLAYRDAGAHGVFVPGLTDPGATQAVADAVDLPLNVLWRPGISPDQLADIGVARISTGSALYRQALAAARDAATAARTGATPAGRSIGYESLQAELASATRRATLA